MRPRPTTATRNTRQRTIILEELRKVRSHPTASELYRLVRRRKPRISLGTVYRNLERLADAGIIRTLEAGRSQRRFDGDMQEHHHVRCVECGRVGDVPARPVGDLAAAFRDLSDFRIVSWRLEFAGVCSACRKRSRVRQSARQRGRKSACVRHLS